MSVEAVMRTMKGNAEKAIKILLAAIPKIAAKDWSGLLQGYEVIQFGMCTFPFKSHPQFISTCVIGH